MREINFPTTSKNEKSDTTSRHKWEGLEFCFVLHIFGKKTFLHPQKGFFTEGVKRNNESLKKTIQTVQKCLFLSSKTSNLFYFTFKNLNPIQNEIHPICHYTPIFHPFLP
jgi:hypothetical protein